MQLGARSTGWIETAKSRQQPRAILPVARHSPGAAGQVEVTCLALMRPRAPSRMCDGLTARCRARSIWNDERDDRLATRAPRLQ